MKYLKKFEDHQAYAAAESGLILPNVSLCVQENHVHYNPTTPPAPQHEYVDLGLPSGTKWATMNVGASSITDYGNYYMYGKGDNQYDDGDEIYEGEEEPLAASADTAAQEWGGEWHMPTSTQIEELIEYTTYQWVEDFQGSGVNGGTFTANEQTLFIPAAGGYYSGSLGGVGEYGYVWSSTPNGYEGAYRLDFVDEYCSLYEDGSRYTGTPIRPVVG